MNRLFRAPALMTAMRLAILLAAAVPASAQTKAVGEPPILAERVLGGLLPPMAERLPSEPLVVDPTRRGRAFGEYGGVWRMLINKAKSIRYGVVYGYARLVGYTQELTLEPDILRAMDVVDGRIFTLSLRRGHKWSDGQPFTSEDFRYWWRDVANNPELSPNGPPDFMLVDGAPPEVRFPDAATVVFEWPAPNPMFLKTLAAARPPFIYRPAHYMKQFHASYADPEELAERITAASARNWAALHNRMDNMYDSDNPDLPTLQPWRMARDLSGRHFLWERNAFFHRVDARGRQLPYIDAIDMTVASAGLIAAKTNAGEADLQATGLSFSDTAILKRGEASGDYVTRLWRNGSASQIALYPNLNYGDPEWRALLRDVRFRRALSLGVDRQLINRALYFGLAVEGANALLSESPLFDESRLRAWAAYDPVQAGALLDEIGLAARDGDGVRLLPDGRRLEVVVEIAGERPEESDALELITETWRRIGVKLVQRSLDRDILRNRVYAGATMLSVWFGWDNGQAGPNDPPDELAPMLQDTLQWPKWGQYFQTSGAAGEPPDTPESQRLLALALTWRKAPDEATRLRIWREMLAIHAEQVFVIGLICQTPQPVTVSSRLRNVPENAVWSWDPGAHFGIYRPDEFFFAPATELAAGGN